MSAVWQLTAKSLIVHQCVECWKYISFRADVLSQWNEMKNMDVQNGLEGPDLMPVFNYRGWWLKMLRGYLSSDMRLHLLLEKKNVDNCVMRR